MKVLETIYYPTCLKGCLNALLKYILHVMFICVCVSMIQNPSHLPQTHEIH